MLHRNCNITPVSPDEFVVHQGIQTTLPAFIIFPFHNVRVAWYPVITKRYNTPNSSTAEIFYWARTKVNWQRPKVDFHSIANDPHKLSVIILVADNQN